VKERRVSIRFDGRVVPAVVSLCCKDAPTRHIIEAGGAYFARVAIVEAAGVVLGPGATAEDVAARYGEIADLSGARTFDAGSEMIMRILSAVSKGSGRADRVRGNNDMPFWKTIGVQQRKIGTVATQSALATGFAFRP
jgi:hypothetical protein